MPDQNRLKAKQSDKRKTWKAMARGKRGVHKLLLVKYLVVKAVNNTIVEKITVGARVAQSPTDPATRLSDVECDAFGDTDGPFEMHHPNRLKDKPRDQMKPWKESARRLRTIVLCHECHVAHHGGRMTSGTESRVH